ncbi:hypothetical protein CAPTEDRAFT_74862, partial [Capitella teleta]
AMLQSALLLLSICAGTVLNTYIPFKVFRDYKLHRSPYYFLVNLSISGLLRSTLCLPVILDTVLHSSVWRHNHSVCKLTAFIWTLLVFAGLFGYFVVALDRYVAILNQRCHARNFHGYKCLGPIVTAWLTAFLLALPPVNDLGTYAFDPVQGQCTFKHVYHTDNDTLAFTAVFVVTLIFILCIYYRVFLFLRTHRKMAPVRHRALRSTNWTFNLHRADQFPLDDRAEPADQAVTVAPAFNNTARGPAIITRLESLTARNEHLTRTAFCSFVAYVLAWLPYTIVSVWSMFDLNGTLPWLLVTIATWMTYCEVVLMP